METAKELLEKMQDLEAEYTPDQYPPVKMKEIRDLRLLVEGAVPAIDLLQSRMEIGQYLQKQDGQWWLFQESGDGVTGSDTLKGILLNLIFLDC